VEGNWLGLDAAGEPLYVTSGGVRAAEEADNTVILRNVIGGQRGPGVSLHDNTRDVLIESNRIGLAPDGASDAGNRDYGVSIIGQPKGSRILRNRIAFNANGGIFVSGSSAFDHTISENSVTDNDGPAVQVLQGANRNIRPPVINFASVTLATGLACAGCLVEVYSDAGDQAEQFEASTTAGADGSFRVERPEGFRYNNLSAIHTDGRNSSGLSAVTVIGAATPTPRPVTPTPVPTRDPDALFDVLLPCLYQPEVRR
jgi:hypothetical protein